MRVFGHAMPTGKLGAEGGVIPISAKSRRPIVEIRRPKAAARCRIKGKFRDFP